MRAMLLRKFSGLKMSSSQKSRALGNPLGQVAEVFGAEDVVQEQADAVFHFDVNVDIDGAAAAAWNPARQSGSILTSMWT